MWLVAFFAVPGLVAAATTRAAGVPAALGLTLCLAAAWLVLPGVWWRVNAFDGLLVLAAGLVGMALAATEARRQAVAAAAVFALTGEVAARVLLAPSFREVAEPTVLMTRVGGSRPCVWDPRLPTHPDVVHLGDSMITSLGGLDVEQTLPALVDARDPARRHVGAGIPGGSLGCSLGVATTAPDARWYVLHVFLGNDIHDMTVPEFWCGGQPAIDHRTTPPTPRCAEAPRPPPFLRRLAYAPPPFVVRQLATVSTLAQALDETWRNTGHGLRSSSGHVDGSAELTATLTLFDDLVNRREAGFAVVLLPIRASAREAMDHDDVEDWRAAAAAWASAHDVPLLDLSERLDQAHATGIPDAALHADEIPGDPHLSARGHALLADDVASWFSDVADQ